MEIKKINIINHMILMTELSNRFDFSYDWTFECVNLSEVYPSCLHVYKDRISTATEMIGICSKNDIPLFYPYELLCSDGSKQLVVPPIVEIRNGKYLLCDGMHRIYSLIKQNVRKAFVFVVNKPTLPLAGEINSWDNVSVEDKQLPAEDNFIDFNRDGLTGYSKFCNSDFFKNY